MIFGLFVLVALFVGLYCIIYLLNFITFIIYLVIWGVVLGRGFGLWCTVGFGGFWVGLNL